MGHGNKIPGVATALMIALVDNRTLVLDYGGCTQEDRHQCQDRKWSNFFDSEVEMDVANLIETNQALNRTLAAQKWDMTWTPGGEQNGGELCQLLGRTCSRSRRKV
jgi:hypothetical protein